MDTSSEKNILLVERLRNEDPEQFFTLVKMHLSFVLDLNAEECDSNLEKKCKTIKWNLPFTKKQKLAVKNNTEGILLTTEFIAQVHPIIEFLSKEENISQEGIFRRSGRVTRQQELKFLLQKGAELNFNEGQFSVHECATVLKNVLSELPESVLTDAHYPAYCQIADLCGEKNQTNEERLLRSLQLLILLLPNENRKFFQEIIELLHLAVSHEGKNRMSADNLATLFTPHLLCPRRLSPEALHTNSQVMSCVVAFMIQKGSELFEVPPTVATDVKAYWKKKERKKLSPSKQMNESLSDGTAAITVFTFVDRERTAQENQTNPTETALAQLYAYIQCLPESSKKQKLIKQFNKENGHGTPLRTDGKKRIKTLNLGDSIKKHLSGFSKTSKRSVQQEVFEREEYNQEGTFSLKNSHNPDEKFLKLKKFTLNKKTDVLKSENSGHLFDDNAIAVTNESLKHSKKAEDCKNLSNFTKFDKEINASYDSNESASKNHLFLEHMVTLSKKRISTSPVKILSSKSRCVSNKYLTPIQYPLNHCARQEHQKLSVSNQNLQKDQNLNKFNNSRSSSGSVQNLSHRNKETNKGKKLSAEDLYKTPKTIVDLNLAPELSENTDFENQFKTPVQKFKTCNLINTNIDGFMSSPNNTNYLPILYGPKNSFLITTSTPAPGNGCLLTPIVDKNNSMSPITKSTKRMPKAMQETMMTPRSRKPVISLSGTDLYNLGNADSLGEDNSENLKPKIPQLMGKKLMLEDSSEEENDSISSTFRNYLFSRNVLTASPVDLSFSSRTDDFLSLSEKSSSRENEKFKILPQILNEAGLSESLLYCLEGNEPESNFIGKNESKICSCPFLDSDENLHHVYETAL